VPLRRSTIPVPVPVDLDAPPRPRRAKRAALAPPAEFGKEPLTWVSQRLSHALGTMRAPGTRPGWAHSLLSGWGESSPGHMPWVYPAGVAAAGAGLYGGYKLTDWLLDRARKHEISSELERARKEYQEAMLGQYAGQKAASADPLDALFEKQAAVWGPLAGMGLLGMGTIGLASGMGAYHWARDRSKTRALEEAIRRRQEALFAQAPRPIVAIPTPHQVGTPPLPGEEEDEEDGLPKAASLAQAADGVLRRFQAQKQQAAQHWQTLINGPPKGGERAQKPQPPQPPQLPTLAGAYAGQRPVPAA
jgi:hypothetical protein